MGATRQNVPTSDLKKNPRFVPFGANLTNLDAKFDIPDNYQSHINENKEEKQTMTSVVGEIIYWAMLLHVTVVYVWLPPFKINKLSLLDENIKWHIVLYKYLIAKYVKRISRRVVYKNSNDKEFPINYHSFVLKKLGYIE